MPPFGKSRASAASTEYSLDVETIPRLYDDPRYAAASELLSKFSRFMERLERARLRLILERQLGAKAPDPRSSGDTSLRARLAALRAEPPLAPEPPADAPATASLAIHRAVQIMSGETVPAPPEHTEQLAELDRRHIAVHLAIIEQTEEVDRIANELTYEYAEKLKPAWDALQLQLYRDAQQLSRTTSRVRALRAAITAAGIRSRSDILLTPNVRAPLMLGDETAWDSEISGWRRILEGWGLLK